MKYKTQQAKRNGKWYPQSVNSETIGTRQICKDIAAASAMTPGDVINVLDQLKEQMVRYLVNGNKVKLEGIGTFYLTSQSQGNGVDTEEEVTPSQINKVMVRFTSEKQASLGGVKKSIPTLAADEIHWEKVEPKKKSSPTPTPTPDPTPGPDEG